MNTCKRDEQSITEGKKSVAIISKGLTLNSTTKVLHACTNSMTLNLCANFSPASNNSLMVLKSESSSESALKVYHLLFLPCLRHDLT